MSRLTRKKNSFPTLLADIDTRNIQVTPTRRPIKRHVPNSTNEVPVPIKRHTPDPPNDEQVEQHTPDPPNEETVETTRTRT